MKNIFKLLILVLIFNDSTIYCKDLNGNTFFHFNFANAGNKRKICDNTDSYKCFSKYVGFEVKKSGLRTDYGAEIYIPSQNLPDISKEFTLSLWVVPLRTIYAQSRIPLITKGRLWQNSDFSLLLNGGMPMFLYSSGKKKLQGINIAGRSYGNTFRYSDPSIKVYDGEDMRFKNNFWAQITVCFTENNLKIYKNGKLLLEKTNTEALPLTLNKRHPIWIGSERIDSEPYCTSNLLINDIRFLNKALSAEQVKKLYEDDRGQYPESYIAQETSSHYYGEKLKGFDPDLQKQLKTTAAFVKETRPKLKQEKIDDAKVVCCNGRAFFSFNNQLYYPIAGYPGIGWFGEQAVKQSAEYIRDFAAEGVDTAFAGGSNNSIYWKGEGKYDWSKFDNGYIELVNANPKLKLIITINTFLPEWFIEKHPEELEKYHSRKDSSSALLVWKQSLIASDLWLKIVNQYINDLVKHIKNASYGANVAGFLLVSGDAGEFYWPATFTGGATGYSENTRKQFCRWVKNKYEGKVEKLRKAWNKPEATFESIEVPSPEARFHLSYEIFRDLKSSRPVIDFREFMGDATFNAIETMSKAVKTASDFKKIVAIYGGYPILFAGKGHTLQQSGMQTSSRILKCPYIDVVATPLDYVKRRGGEAGLNINPYNGSSRLYDKMLYLENDLRTHFWQINNFGKTKDLDETINVIKRGIGYTLTNGSGLEFLAIAGNASFHHEKIMDTIGKGMKTGIQAIKMDNSSNAEVAIIFDEKSLSYTTWSKDPFMDNLCWGTYSEAVKMGAPFDMYLLEDMKNQKMPDYKMYIFINAFYTDKATRDAVVAKVRKNNAVSVWCYAPGYIDKQQYGLKSMEELTGIHFSIDNSAKIRVINIVDKSSPVTKYVKQNVPFNIAPAFFADDSKVKVLGTVEDKPALVIKSFPNWRSVYSLIPLDKELLQGLCDYAGVHVYSRTFDIFNCNRSFMMLHATGSGDKFIDLPGKSNVKECFSGRVVGKGVKQFTISGLKRGNTRLYQILPVR